MGSPVNRLADVITPREIQVTFVKCAMRMPRARHNGFLVYKLRDMAVKLLHGQAIVPQWHHMGMDQRRYWLW